MAYNTKIINKTIIKHFENRPLTEIQDEYCIREMDDELTNLLVTNGQIMCDDIALVIATPKGYQVQIATDEKKAYIKPPADQWPTRKQDKESVLARIIMDYETKKGTKPKEGAYKRTKCQK